MYREFLKFDTHQTQNNSKLGKELELTFPQRLHTNVTKPTRRYSALTAREMQLQTTARHPLTPTRMAAVRQRAETSVGCRGIGALCSVAGTPGGVTAGGQWGVLRNFSVELARMTRQALFWESTHRK